jgi:hypothetical protein
MQHPVLARAIERLARVGEQAGISVEQMILILNSGMSVDDLLEIIDRSLPAPRGETHRSSRWIM